MTGAGTADLLREDRTGRDSRQRGPRPCHRVGGRPPPSPLSSSKFDHEETPHPVFPARGKPAESRRVSDARGKEHRSRWRRRGTAAITTGFGRWAGRSRSVGSVLTFHDGKGGKTLGPDRVDRRVGSGGVGRARRPGLGPGRLRLADGALRVDARARIDGLVADRAASPGRGRRDRRAVAIGVHPVHPVVRRAPRGAQDGPRELLEWAG